MNIADAVAAPANRDWRLTRIEKTEDQTKVELTLLRGDEPRLVFACEDWNLELAIAKANRLIFDQYDPIPQAPQD
jgi:hypothetical protein